MRLFLFNKITNKMSYKIKNFIQQVLFVLVDLGISTKETDGQRQVEKPGSGFFQPSKYICPDYQSQLLDIEPNNHARQTGKIDHSLPKSS